MDRPQFRLTLTNAGKASASNVYIRFDSHTPIEVQNATNEYFVRRSDTPSHHHDFTFNRSIHPSQNILLCVGKLTGEGNVFSLYAYMDNQDGCFYRFQFDGWFIRYDRTIMIYPEPIPAGEGHIVR